MSNLPEQEHDLFFRVWLGILAFVNDKYGIVKDFGHPQKPLGIELKTIVKLKDTLWEHTSLIDEYIQSVWDMPNEQIQILQSWKNAVAGTFFVIKHLKKYTVFLDEKRKILYGVLGITNPISDVLRNAVLPAVVSTVLLPFKNQIIYDTLLYTKPVIFGSNLTRELREMYTEINNKNGITTSLI